MCSGLINVLVEQKLLSLNAIAQIGMMWWVSSVVFCATVIAMIWQYKEQLINQEYFIYIVYAVNFLFVSIVTFGLWLSFSAIYIGYETHLLINEDSMFVSVGIWPVTIAVGCLIGTTSFILYTLVWFKFKHTVIGEHSRETSNFNSEVDE